jgi:hypothetical protein
VEGVSLEGIWKKFAANSKDAPTVMKTTKAGTAPYTKVRLKIP